MKIRIYIQGVQHFLDLKYLFLNFMYISGCDNLVLNLLQVFQKLLLEGGLVEILFIYCMSSATDVVQVVLYRLKQGADLNYIFFHFFLCLVVHNDFFDGG